MSIFVQWENNKTPLNAENLNVINDVAKQLGEDVAHLSDVVVDIDENFSAKVQNELTEVKSSINTINETTSRLQQQTSSNNTNITNIQRTIADNNSALEEKINTNKNNLTTLQNVVNDNKTELDGKITTNKNNLNTLQQNVNNINSTLDNKITVNKNKLDNLEQNINNVNSTLDGKIATNKDNILNIQNSLLTGQYTSYSGMNLACNDTLSSKTSNMLIKGKTYQNLIIGDVFNHDKLKEVKWIETSKPLQTNQLYTFQIRVLENTLDTPFLVSGWNLAGCSDNSVKMDDSTIPGDIEIFAAKEVGIKKFTFGFKSLEKPDSKIRLSFFNQNQDKATGSVKFELVLFEGNWLNKKIPENVTNIESVGEKENNKISILSRNKNLWDVDDFGITNGVYNGVEITRLDNGFKFNGVATEGYTKHCIINYVDKFELGKTYTLTGELFTFENTYADGHKTWKKDITVTEDLVKVSCYLQWLDSSAVFDNLIVTPQIEEGTVGTAYVKSNYNKKEILMSLDGGLKSLPNGTCDTIEQREDGVYLVQRVGKVVLNGSEDWRFTSDNVQYDGVVGYALRNVLDIKKTGDKYVAPICNTLKGVDYNLWRQPIEGVVTENNINDNINDTQLQLNLNINRMNGNGTIQSLKDWLQDNPTTAYYELENTIETKLNIKDINVETFDDLTYVLTNNNIQPELEFKIPSNLGALIQNNAKKINELFKLIDELIIPQLTTNTSDIAMLQITK